MNALTYEQGLPVKVRGVRCLLGEEEQECQQEGREDDQCSRCSGFEAKHHDMHITRRPLRNKDGVSFPLDKTSFRHDHRIHIESLTSTWFGRRLMTSIRLISAAILLLASMAPAVAAPADEASRDLANTSYRHLNMAYMCRQAIGISQFREARIAVENVLRTTGLPADAAMSSVDDMVSRIIAAPQSTPPAFNECIARIARTRQALPASRAQFHQLADHGLDADQP
jgi:hypothetical protein